MSVYSQASMDWDNLKFFLALAETGSLSRASEKLRVDHSTVARRIEMLEHNLGVRLVERLSRSYRLTAEGERVRDRAKEIEAGITDIARFAQGVDRSPHRVVRVSGPPTFVSQFLAPRLLPLQGEQPGFSARANTTSRFGWSGRSRKGLWRGGWRSWHTGSTGRAITSPGAARIPRIFLATMTASITCRSSVG
jgi:DNA-binding transcriptional LysR family regulator